MRITRNKPCRNIEVLRNDNFICFSTLGAQKCETVEQLIGFSMYYQSFMV